MDPHEKANRLLRIATEMEKRLHLGSRRHKRDQVGARRRFKRQCLQLLITHRMLAEALETAYRGHLEECHTIARMQRVTRNLSLFTEPYTLHVQALALLQEFRKESGAWFLNVEQWLRDNKVRLSEREWQAALSLSELERQHLRKDAASVPFPRLFDTMQAMSAPAQQMLAFLAERSG